MMSAAESPDGDSTRAVKAVSAKAVPGQPVASAPVPASTYHLSPDETADLDVYGRSSNPTWRQLESALAQLEGASAALAFGSGMAAITATLRVLTKPGSVLVVPADGYYQVRRYATERLAPLGVTVVEAESAQMYAAAADADMVLAETPTNPGLDVVDLRRLATICHGRGARLVVDTAGLRFERQCRNAQALATMLRDHPAARTVRYPGLTDDSAHPIAAAQMRRFGGLVCVELADSAAVHALVQRSELLIAATSFGGIHTSVDRRARWGDAVGEGFARIALGIEDTEDLLADIEQALGSA